MERTVGTTVRGLRVPIINQGDNLEEIIIETVLNAAKAESFAIEDRDIVTITESIVARAQGNYATVDHIATDIHAKFGDETVGVIFPILSRNRFSICLRGIQEKLKELTGKTVEVMIYGDGAFKDPVGKIWELADPFVLIDNLCYFARLASGIFPPRFLTSLMNGSCA